MNPFDRVVLDEPPLRLDVDAVVVRGRARARRRRAAVLTGAAMAVGLVAVTGALTASGGTDRLLVEGGVAASSAPSASPSAAVVIDPVPTSPPSQSRADARRDGILPAVAALSYDRRVRIAGIAVAPEGRWALSRIPFEPKVLGDEAGRYGTDWISTTEYGELLLLDPTGSRIVRAYPLPGVPLQTLLVSNDAVYCARQGDGGLPVSMLCRVDRKTLAATVRVFPPGPDAPDPVSPASYRDGWKVTLGPSENVFSEVKRCEGGVCVEGPDGKATIDPVSLTITP